MSSIQTRRRLLCYEKNSVIKKKKRFESLTGYCNPKVHSLFQLLFSLSISFSHVRTLLSLISSLCYLLEIPRPKSKSPALYSLSLAQCIWRYCFCVFCDICCCFCLGVTPFPNFYSKFSGLVLGISL